MEQVVTTALNSAWFYVFLIALMDGLNLACPNGCPPTVVLAVPLASITAAQAARLHAQ